MNTNVVAAGRVLFADNLLDVGFIDYSETG